jgi:hypothetical protein
VQFLAAPASPTPTILATLFTRVVFISTHKMNMEPELDGGSKQDLNGLILQLGIISHYLQDNIFDLHTPTIS